MRKISKSILSIFIAIAMICINCQIQKPEKVQALASDKTADEAIAWVKSKLGQGLDMDGVYGVQCVDLILAYYDYLGVPRSSGNGCDYATNTLPAGWQRIAGAQPQKGDILIYTGGYGHVAIYESDRSHYHQNFNNVGPVQQVTYMYNGLSNTYWGVIRPNFGTGSSVDTTVYFTEQSVLFTDDHNAGVYTKIQNPTCQNIQTVGCRIYDASGNLINNYTESCGLTTSYVNYTCNFISDMGYSLQPGTTYKYQQYAIVNGIEYKDQVFSFSTTITDSENPVISDVEVIKDSEGYMVYCTVTDNIGVTSVKFPTWSDYNGQDDIIWYESTSVDGNRYGCRINISDHNNEYGTYLTHIYAYDAAGNAPCMAIGVEIALLSVVSETNVSEVEVGDEVTITGVATGGSGEYTYSILMQNTDTNSWYRFSDFKESNTVAWKASKTGNRKFYVEVKDSTGKVVRSSGVKVSVKAKTEPLAVTGKINAANVNVGDEVTVTGLATGGSGEYTYSILMQNTDTNSWYRFSGFKSSNTVTWKAGKAGNRKFYVEVKDSTGKVVRSSGLKVAVTEKQEELSILAGADVSAVKTGENVNVWGIAMGGSGSYTYSILMQNTDTNAWHRFSDFKASNNLTWKAGKAGNRKFYVEVKDSTGTVIRSSAVKVKVS